MERESPSSWPTSFFFFCRHRAGTLNESSEKTMAKGSDPIPGTADLWEPEVLDWLELEAAAREVFRLYGYTELRTPIFERTKVFVHSIGAETEVVQKEMYTFQDRGGRNLTLRPEGTAGVMRAVAHHGLADGEELRVFYHGPMFRGEKPAAGRRRQFHQIGVEAVGACAPGQDVETIAMLMQYLERIGIADARLLLNTRGLPADRDAVSAALREHFSMRIQDMCEDCQRRLTGNIWRILDCKNDSCQDVIRTAPKMLDLVGPESRAFFAEVCAGLDALGVSYAIEPRLVRGLDYYVHTVFEVVHHGLGAQDALAGGGRYIIRLPGTNRDMDGVGFAAGVERLLLARASMGRTATAGPDAEVFIAALGAPALPPALALAQELRTAGRRVLCTLVARSMKAQLRSANKLGVPAVLILGEDEIRSGTVMAKDMNTSEQCSVARDQLDAWLDSRAR